MTVEKIFIRPPDAAALVERPRVQVVASAGIEGGRCFDCHDAPGQNITLVEAEEIEAFAQARGLAVDLSLTGRNIVTRGVRLNALVGREFGLGALRLRGVELLVGDALGARESDRA